MDEYESFEDIKFKLIEDLKKDATEVINIRLLRKEDLIGLHHSFGQWIRNNYKLWSPDNPLTSGYETNPDKHPDVISQKLIEEIWSHFNEEV